MIHKPELLAPAGTLDAVKRVIEAGADAVYVGGKGLNMRQHRKSYNLTDEEIAGAIQWVHERGKKLYFTLNSLVLDDQLPQVRQILSLLAHARPDALIVQDLAVAALARELCVEIPLHASTMMNVHNSETATTLRMMGFTRVITSRDIPLHQVRRIAEQSGLETEYFVHGDMCVAQGSQCYLSGILFGESANCGRCMKPCRWEWELVDLNGNAGLPGPTRGYLLAKKDICLFHYIPELIQNRVVSLKIEGRMRTAEFLAEIVAIYRKAIDAYCQNPTQYATQVADFQQLWDRRVRPFNASLAFGNPGADSVDTTGAREPRFFSHHAPELELTSPDPLPAAILSDTPDIVVHVSNTQQAHAALDAGARGIYLNGDGFVQYAGLFTNEWLRSFVEQANHNGSRVALMMPAIAEELEMLEWGDWLRSLRSIKGLAIGVASLGGVHLAHSLKIQEIIADYPLNMTNSVAVDELSTLGVGRVTASVELNHSQLTRLIRQSRLPVEVIAQGPVAGMVLEHCAVAAACGAHAHDTCTLACRRGRFALKDKAGHLYRLEMDRRCRTHLYTPRDVCGLPHLASLAASGASALRIEAQFETPETVRLLVKSWLDGLASLRSGTPIDAMEVTETLQTATGRPLCDGPFYYSR